MKGRTFAVSWGRYGGFYVSRYPSTRLGDGTYGRVCLGWVAVTFLPVELDDLMRAYMDALDAVRARGETE